HATRAVVRPARSSASVTNVSSCRTWRAYAEERSICSYRSSVSRTTSSFAVPPILDREPRIAFEDLLCQAWPLARCPEFRRMDDAIAQRPAVGPLAARDGARNADELRPHLIRGEPNGCIAVTTEIDELKVRR